MKKPKFSANFLLKNSKYALITALLIAGSIIMIDSIIALISDYIKGEHTSWILLGLGLVIVVIGGYLAGRKIK